MKITANMVTLARIALVPVPCAMLLSRNPHYVWTGLAIGILLGATDALDGYLARRDGPTVLGALLDPVADKLFVAAFLFPIVSLEHSPAWIIALILVRELSITALRSSMEVRSAHLKTSQLGKLKTVVQMGGLGVYVLLMFTPVEWGPFLHGGGIGGLLVVALVFLARGRRPPYWVVAGVPLWALVLALSLTLTNAQATIAVFAIMAVVSWVSGVDYVAGAWRVVRQQGFTQGDGARLFWALANGIAPVLAVDADLRIVVPLLIGYAANLALGGIDNIAVAERGRTSLAAFWVTGVAALLAGAAAVWRWAGSGSDGLLLVASGIYVLASGIVGAALFWANRRVFFPDAEEAEKA